MGKFLVQIEKIVQKALSDDVTAAKEVMAFLGKPKVGCVSELEEHKSAVNAMAFSSDNKFVISGSHDKTLRVWKIADGLASMKCVAELEGHTDWVTALAISSDNSFAISA